MVLQGQSLFVGDRRWKRLPSRAVIHLDAQSKGYLTAVLILISLTIGWNAVSGGDWYTEEEEEVDTDALQKASQVRTLVFWAGMGLVGLSLLNLFLVMVGMEIPKIPERLPGLVSWAGALTMLAGCLAWYLLKPDSVSGLGDDFWLGITAGAFALLAGFIGSFTSTD